jgi:pimeloyl-ACP methyl ester carboxylesterase
VKRLAGLVAATTMTAAALAGVLAAPSSAAPATGNEPAASSSAQATTEERMLSSVPVPRLRWGSCGEGLEAFQCATAKVPLDYDHPHGRTITLALTRLPASDPDRRIGSLFTNPGGPGGSGVDFVQQGAQVLYTADVRARFDIIGFDPRGVARSTPATCFDTQAEEDEFFADTVLFPLTSAEERRYDREQRALAAACAATSAERFRHISTANVARDMDLLRRAVGDRKLNYAGYSYGTFLGATYAKLFPNRIRAMVLDGTIDPREYSGVQRRFRFLPLANRIEQDRGGAEVFDQFVQLCAQAGPERCSLAGLGDPATLSREMFDELKTEPVVLEFPDGSTLTITYQIAVATTFLSLYSPGAWSDLADLLSVLVLATSQPAAADRKPASVSAGVAALIRQGTTREGEDYASIGGALGSVCVDARTPARVVFPAVADRQDRRYPDFGRFRTWVGYACSYFREEGIRDTDAYTGPWQQTTSTHVLVLGTRHDPATPYRNTRPYASLFPRATVVTLNGWGHTTLGQSRCTDAQVTDYLLEPRRHRADAVCATDVVPFTTPGPAAQDRADAARAAVANAGPGGI